MTSWLIRFCTTQRRVILSVYSGAQSTKLLSTIALFYQNSVRCLGLFVSVNRQTYKNACPTQLFAQQSVATLLLHHTNSITIITMRFNLSALVFLSVLSTTAMGSPAPASDAPQCLQKSLYCNKYLGLTCCAGLRCLGHPPLGGVSDLYNGV
jgi:hypothetical protein